jgi:hypothetical protein
MFAIDFFLTLSLTSWNAPFPSNYWDTTFENLLCFLSDKHNIWTSQFFMTVIMY